MSNRRKIGAIKIMGMALALHKNFEENPLFKNFSEEVIDSKTKNDKLIKQRRRQQFKRK